VEEVEGEEAEKEDEECADDPITIEDLPDHGELVEMNREEGVFQSLRACPHLKKFTDE